MHWTKIGIVIAILALVGSYGCQRTKMKPKRTMPEMVALYEKGEVVNRRISSAEKSKIPANISAMLMPSIDIDMPEIEDDDDDNRFDIAVKDLPARQFFMGLVAGTPHSMVVNPKVQDEITLNLKNVTIEEALNAARDAYGFEFIETSYGYKVMPAGLETRVFHVNYINIQRTGTSMLNVSAGQLTSSGTRTGSGNSASRSNRSDTGQGTGQRGRNLFNASVGTLSTTDFWPELELTVRAIIGGGEEGRTVVISPQAGIVVVRAYPDELRDVARYLDQSELALTRQVILETQILEVQLNDSFQAGINWGYISSQLNIQNSALSPLSGATPFSGTPFAASGGVFGQSSSGVSGSSALEDFSGIFGAAVNASNFTSIVKLLSTQGNVQVLSSPRISTLNNQKAVIKVGSEEFFVTEVSGNTAAAGGGTSSSQNVELTPFFSGIALDVTPQISKDGSVILHVHPTISEVSDTTKEVEVQGVITKLPSARSEIRESDSIVRARNGQVMIIGGLMKTTVGENIASTPVLGRIPLLGALFRRTQQLAQKSELVILLRPIVVDNNTWTKEMRKGRESLRNVERGFHIGDKTHIFEPSGEYQEE